MWCGKVQNYLLFFLLICFSTSNCHLYTCSVYSFVLIINSYCYLSTLCCFGGKVNKFISFIARKRRKTYVLRSI